jgi:hypothetical protein
MMRSVRPMSFPFLHHKFALVHLFFMRVHCCENCNCSALCIFYADGETVGGGGGGRLINVSVKVTRWEKRDK